MPDGICIYCGKILTYVSENVCDDCKNRSIVGRKIIDKQKGKSAAAHELLEILKGDKAKEKLNQVARKTKWHFVEQGLTEAEADWIVTGYLGGFDAALQMVENYEKAMQDHLFKMISAEMIAKVKKLRKESE